MSRKAHKKSAVEPSEPAVAAVPATEPVDLAGDLIIGAAEIGAVLGRPGREIYYLGASGRLPIFKWGAKLAARRSTLTAYVLGLERAAGQKA
jgi:hypothetical protein